MSTSAEPSDVARLMRCDSPPDSVDDRPIERQVVETDVAQEPEPLRISRSTLSAIAASFSDSSSAAKNASASRTVSARRIDRPAADPHVARLAAQPRAAAIRAGQVAAIPAQEDADVHLVFLPFEPAEEPLTPS